MTAIQPEAPYILPQPPPDDWKADGLCRKLGTPDDWFPDDREVRSERARDAAKACTWCPVQLACLRYALDRVEVHGIWGGKTPRQRAMILSRRRRDAQDVPA